MKKIWTEDYKITSFLVNLRGQAGLYAILNLVQDVGWMHAIHLDVRLPKNRGWVFTRQKLAMTEWPAWNKTVTIRTWLRPPQDSFLFRDYEIHDGERKIGECTSTFTVMDLETRRIAIEDWSKYEDIWRPDGHLAHRPEKVLFSGDVEDLQEFQVRNSDIDLNRHVNNTKYAQWALDSLPIDALRGGFDLREYDVNFLAEMKAGDVVTVQKTKTDLPDGKEMIIGFQGLRKTDGKPAFTARMRVGIRHA